MAEKKKGWLERLMPMEDLSKMTITELNEYTAKLNEQTARRNRGTLYIIGVTALIAWLSLVLSMARDYGWLHW